jgi:hypothetical protein
MALPGLVILAKIAANASPVNKVPVPQGWPGSSDGACAKMRRFPHNHQRGNGMRVLLRGAAIAALLLGGGAAVRAEDTVMFPDPQGKLVRIPIAHSYEQCRKNGRHLGYPDSDSHAWCTEHCKGNGSICQ